MYKVLTMNATSVRFLGPVLTLALASLFACQSHAGILEDDEARRAILELRQRADANQQRFGEDIRKANEENAQLRRSVLDLSNQLELIRAEMARMRGQDEQLTRDLAEVQKRQRDMVQGVEERFRKFEPGKVTVDGIEFNASPSEVRDFEAALATLRRGDFAAAQNAFAEFDRRYPESGYKASTLFWLGNAQYALRNYKEAIVNFKALLAYAPDHARAAEAALSIANCQVELKDTKSARKTLEDLIKVYPQAEAAAVAKGRLTKLK